LIFRQITYEDLGRASYLIGDEDAAVAAVVDPSGTRQRRESLVRVRKRRAESRRS